MKQIVQLAVLACATASAFGDVLTNGSFEQNAYFNERAFFPRLDDTNGSAPTGWTRDGDTYAEYIRNFELYQGVTIYNVADGAYAIGMHGGEWWEQSFVTVPGTQYEVTFSAAFGSVWYEPVGYFRPGTTPGSVSVTGTNALYSGGYSGTTAAPTGLTLIDSPFVWSSNTFTFTADSASTVIRFSGPSDPNDGYLFVDNASVTAIPTPSAAAIGGLGLCAFIVRRRRPGGAGA